MNKRNAIEKNQMKKCQPADVAISAPLPASPVVRDSHADESQSWKVALRNSSPACRAPLRTSAKLTRSRAPMKFGIRSTENYTSFLNRFKNIQKKICKCYCLNKYSNVRQYMSDVKYVFLRKF